METTRPHPLFSQWTLGNSATGEETFYVKEVLGGRSLFHFHCGMRMDRVLEFRKDFLGNIKRHGLTPASWKCRVCDSRQYNHD